MDGPAKHALTGRPSNNSAGRVRGSGEVGKLRAQLMAFLPEAMAALKAGVVARDPASLRLYFERVIPSWKAEGAPVLVPGLTGTPTQQARAVLACAADGAIPLDQAREFVAALAQIAGIEVIDELRLQLDRMEHGEIA